MFSGVIERAESAPSTQQQQPLRITWHRETHWGSASIDDGGSASYSLLPSLPLAEMHILPRALFFVYHLSNRHHRSIPHSLSSPLCLCLPVSPSPRGASSPCLVSTFFRLIIVCVLSAHALLKATPNALPNIVSQRKQYLRPSVFTNV